jgi:hypothetical protein
MAQPMTQPTPEASPDAGPVLSPMATHAKVFSPRQDMLHAVFWMALGAGTLFESWRMDRLENQGAHPFTVPGLLPGLLGVALMFFGALLMLRSWGRMQDGVAVTPVDPETQTPSAQRRTALVLALCVGFTGGLVGRGLPFWAAAALFITVAIGVLHPKAEHRVSRVLIKALLIGVIAGWVITLVFQEFFLVRLP